MKVLKGECGEAKVFTDLIEQTAIDQIETLLNQDFIKDSTIRIMPDVHAGAGCTIGTTMTIKDRVCPNLVGVDIGCGMLTSVLSRTDLDLEKLDSFIRNHIPSGFNIRDFKEAHPYTYIQEARLPELICEKHVDLDRAFRSLGTLGGGNHFIEVDGDDEGCLYLVIHTGSRHLGVEVAKYYQKVAEKELSEVHRHSIDIFIDSMKQAGKQDSISEKLKTIRLQYSKVPKDLSYVFGPWFEDYIHDMQIVQEYAKWNRIAIADDIKIHMDIAVDTVDEFETVHNYISMDDMILRKGAVSARKGEKLIIPINMRDGSLLCIGKGNSDWNYSAPHGAGRLMSRSDARKTFSMDDFDNSMKGIFTTSISVDTLDECPMAYKPIDSIINNIGDTVDICKIIKPIYNFKAGETSAQKEKV